jgi:carboxylate-amine ligase
VAALAQCLVARLDSLIDQGYTLPCPKAWIVGQNKWRAARHGIDAELIVDEQGTLAPIREAIEELVEELTPAGRRLGCEAELLGALTVLEHGPSYVRQRRWIEAGATLSDVVDRLIEELRSDQPG